MQRKLISQNGPFRYIVQSDIDQPFKNRLQSVNGLELSDFLIHNRENRHVFVYEYDEKILCVMVFDDMEDHFYLNLIENNDAYEKECDEINPAPKLILYAERVARSLGYKKIRLDALEPLVPYYEKLGYAPIGSAIDKSYGMLEKMKKDLS